MKILADKRCIIGEGPIWNEKEETLYFTNGGGREYCKCRLAEDFSDIACGKHVSDIYQTKSVSLKKDCAAICFDKNNTMIISCGDGVFAINKDGTYKDIYNTEKYDIKYANDMKVGPDGKIYVGTQSEKRMGISKKINGRLYSIDKFGQVKVLLEDLQLSNGMDWSVDERFLYHTDSDTNIIKEYEFDKEKGEICFTNRCVEVLGVDGFTVANDNKIYASCWGMGHIAVINLKSMTVEDYITIPCNIPTSCCFCGNDMSILAITTASFDADIQKDKNAGFTMLMKIGVNGRKPYLFG